MTRLIERLAMTTDYVSSRDDPERYLRDLAAVGFRSIHWCHQWNTDYRYGDAEIDLLARLMGELGLKLNDLHASHGEHDRWDSADEEVRRRGLALVRNRMAMTSRLGGDVVVIHLETEPRDAAKRESFWAAARRTLDEVASISAATGVRVAIENLVNDNFDTLERVFEWYGLDFVGLCYDSGHGNVAGNGLERLARVKDRLIALHLHDNDGTADRHWIPMTGTVDWQRLAEIIAASGYHKRAMTIESNMREASSADEAAWLAQLVAGGGRFAAMVEAAEVAGRDGKD